MPDATRSQQAKLLDEVRNVPCLHHYSIHTERAYVMKARKKKTAAETLQILLDEEAERLQYWNVHHELEGKFSRNQMDDRLL